MGKYEDEACRRLGLLLRARQVKQEVLAQAVGHSQSWVSNYLQGTQGANLDELAKMVAVFDLPLAVLFDERSNAAETEIVVLFRALPAHRQALLLRMIREFKPTSVENAPPMTSVQQIVQIWPSLSPQQQADLVTRAQAWAIAADPVGNLR